MKEKLQKGKEWFVKNRTNIIRYGIPALMLAVVLMGVVTPAFAQETTLDIDTDAMTNDLFRGANIIIAALGAVMFLLAGFKLGGILIRGIVDAIGGIRF
jgi:protein-S-isoprenylcysteine O-methyltransferase Ste14